MKKNESLDEGTFMYINKDELDHFEYLFRKLKNACISYFDVWSELKKDLISERTQLSVDDPRYIFLTKVLGKMSLLEIRFFSRLCVSDILEYEEIYDDFGDDE